MRITYDDVEQRVNYEINNQNRKNNNFLYDGEREMIKNAIKFENLKFLAEFTSRILKESNKILRSSIYEIHINNA